MTQQNEIHSLVLEHRRLYVQEANKEVIFRDLRLLKSEICGLDKVKFDQAVDFLLSFDETFVSIIYSALRLQLGVYSEQFKTNLTNAPLWLQLVRDNNSSRKYSLVWRNNTESLFSAFGINLTNILDSNADPSKLYALGLHDKIFEGLSEERCKYWQLKTSPLEFEPEKFLEKVSTLLHISKERKMLLRARYLILLIQSGKHLTQWHWENFFSLSEVFEINEKQKEQHSHLYAQLLNSINYCALKEKNHDLMNLVFEKIDQLLPFVEGKTFNHLKGINKFHHYICSFEKSKDVNLLINAIEEDSGFFDYYYHLADVCYGKDKTIAKSCYEIALATSPLTLELINDYGYLLSELETRKAEEWQRLILGLELFAKEDFDEQ